MNEPLCVKCGCADIYTVYHKRGCDKPGCRSCSQCSYSSHAKRHTEHLHRTCRGCQYDWTDDTLAASSAGVRTEGGA